MSELAVLTELKELTEQKSPNQNKQKALARHRLPMADQADRGGVGHQKVYLLLYETWKFIFSVNKRT